MIIVGIWNFHSEDFKNQSLFIWNGKYIRSIMCRSYVQVYLYTIYGSSAPDILPQFVPI
jgi:hypothetical protein